MTAPRIGWGAGGEEASSAGPAPPRLCSSRGSAGTRKGAEDTQHQETAPARSSSPSVASGGAAVPRPPVLALGMEVEKVLCLKIRQSLGVREEGLPWELAPAGLEDRLVRGGLLRGSPHAGEDALPLSAAMAGEEDTGDTQQRH